MDWFKVSITVLVVYTLIASFFIKKTKAYFSCLVLSCAFAVGSIFIYDMLLEYQEPLENTIITIVKALNDLYV